VGRERYCGVRSQASVLSQIKCIEEGGLLSEYEKSEIEQRVECECKGERTKSCRSGGGEC